MDKEAQAPRRSRRKAAVDAIPTTPDPIEIAMIAAASGKPLPNAARDVLVKHARLIDCQAELAKAQCSELKLRRVGEGVRAVLWGTLAVAALAIIGVIAAVVIRASRSDALIVQSFRVPPRLEAQGLKGEVIATQVLDKLAEMQGLTSSVRAASTYANNWEDELKIDIPNTGTSTDQVWKLLRAWLGEETRISGEVIEKDGGLALTVRVGSSPGQRFQSVGTDLDALITKGAELVYRQTQPYRYAMYLGDNGPEVERLPVLRQLTVHASPVERKWAYSGLSYDANTRGDFAGSVKMAARALAIDPVMIPALANGSQARQLLGHDQLALDMRIRLGKASIDTDEYEPVVAASGHCGTKFDVADALRDPRMADEAAACLEGSNALDVGSPALARAGAAFLRHDPALGTKFGTLATAAFPAALTERYKSQVRLFAEMERGASPALVTALEDFRKHAVLPASAGSFATYVNAAAPVQDWPTEAEVLLKLGRRDEAQALIARTPLDCYDCVRVRGLAAQAAGDAAAAQRWFAEAGAPRAPPPRGVRRLGPFPCPAPPLSSRRSSLHRGRSACAELGGSAQILGRCARCRGEGRASQK